MQHFPNLHDLGNFFPSELLKLRFYGKLFGKNSDCNIIFIVKEVRVMNAIAQNRAEVGL